MPLCSLLFEDRGRKDELEQALCCIISVIPHVFVVVVDNAKAAAAEEWSNLQHAYRARISIVTFDNRLYQSAFMIYQHHIITICLAELENLVADISIGRF